MGQIEQITPREAWILVGCCAGIVIFILGIFALINEWMLRREMRERKKGKGNS